MYIDILGGEGEGEGEEGRERETDTSLDVLRCIYR